MMFILLANAKLNNVQPSVQRLWRNSSTARYKNSIVGPSLNSRSAKIECTRLERQSSPNQHGWKPFGAALA
eukprot:COSAG02_NODE_4014_length_5905_cov_3.990872_5_plen_71_part_00